ncbi:MAG: metal-dependent hydrolase [Promethearchaeota archaeon]
MDFFTHFLVGLLISAFALNRFGLAMVIYMGFMAVSPDFDVVFESFKFIRRNKNLAHKGISHSYVFAIVITAITGGIFSLVTKIPFLYVWPLGFLFYCLHITLDFLAASKTPIFYPISRKRYRFFIDRAINFYMLLISISIMLSYIIIFFVWPAINLVVFSYYVSGFYIAYFLWRIVMKIYFKIKLPSSDRFIPGVSPFTYYIYSTKKVSDEKHFKLVKRNIFTSYSKTLIDTKLKLNSNQALFYEKSLILAKDYGFFSKWEDRIPFITENDNTINVTIFLAESYIRNSGYGFQVHFDKDTEEIIDKTEGFNLHIKNKAIY